MNYDPRRFGAKLLRGHLKMLDAGMKNSRMSGKEILGKASELTGNKYKRGQYAGRAGQWSSQHPPNTSQSRRHNDEHFANDDDRSG